MNNKKNYYELRYDEEQLKIIIEALEEAHSYYNEYFYEDYENFEELEEIIRKLKELR